MSNSPIPDAPALSARLARAIVLGFLGLVCGVGLFDGLHWLLRGPAAGGRQRELPLDRGSLLRGGTTSAAESNLQNGSAFAARVRPSWNELRLRALGDAGRSVVAGRDGWLFLASDVRPPRDTPRLQRESAAHVEAGALALRTRDTATLLVVVPDKSTLALDELPPGFSAPGQSYTALLGELRSRGLDAPDLHEWMKCGPDVQWYRRDDTHWTLAGVERIALLLACRVRARCGTNAGAAPTVEARLLPWPSFHGIRPDLLNSLAIAAGGATWNRYVDPEHGRVLGVQRPSAPPRIALAGTSMSFKQLREQLCSELGVEIANYAQAGAGSSGKFVELLLDLAAERIPAPQLVIWETVERYGREGPCLTFPTLPAALDAIYVSQWQPWSRLEPTSHAQRDLATLARPPLEGEPLPQRLDTWDVRRFEFGDPLSARALDQAWSPENPPASPAELGLTRFVLPANGTFAVAFEEPGHGLAMVGPGFVKQQWSDAILQRWTPGHARLPIVGADWITGIEIASRAEDREPQPTEWRLESAWREVGTCSVQTVDGRRRIELGGASAERIVLDGTLALQFEVDSSQASLGKLRSSPDAVIEFPLPAGHSCCVIPLRSGVEWAAGLEIGSTGFAHATVIELELPPECRLGQRMLQLSLRP